MGVLKNARPARPQPLGRAERTEEVREHGQGRPAARAHRSASARRREAAPAKAGERRWGHFSTLPKSIILESSSLSGWASSSWS
jgi:hypothetical protein